MNRLRLTVLLVLLAAQAGCVAAAPEFLADTRGLTDDAPSIRRKTIRALVLRGRKEAAPEISFLVDPRFEENARVRAAAANGLRALQYQPAAPLLAKGLNDEDALVRLQCAQGLVELGTPKQVPALVETATDMHASSALRIEAVRALDRIGHPRTVPVLIQLIEDFDAGVRFAVRRALTHMAGRDLGPSASSWKRWWRSMKAESDD